MKLKKFKDSTVKKERVRRDSVFFGSNLILMSSLWTMEL